MGAALLVLDFVSTSVVSAATAASYLAGEVSLPFPPFVAAVLVFTIFTSVSLAGTRESARVALAVLIFHVWVIPILSLLLTHAPPIFTHRLEQ